MRELDCPNELTTSQETVEAPPTVETPTDLIRIEPMVERPEPLIPPPAPAASVPPPADSDEADGGALSDHAALELIGAIGRNGAEPEPIRNVEPTLPDSPPEPEPPGVPAVLDAVHGLADQVNGRLDVLQALVERELRAEMTRERVVDRLHAELQEYKQDLLMKVMRPVFVDLIQLHDEITKMEESRRPPAAAGSKSQSESEAEAESGSAAESKSESETESPADPEIDPTRSCLESIRIGIEDVLYRQGVEPYQQDSTVFDARRQRVLTTVPTEDPELNKTVAARIRQGFQLGEKIIRPEIVSVYTLKK